VAAQQGFSLTNEALACTKGDPRDGLRIEDIDLFASDSINLETLEKLREKWIGGRYGALYRWHWRKESLTYALERIGEIKEEKSGEFDKHCRGLRRAAIDCVSLQLLNQITNTSETEYATQVAFVNQQAKEFVSVGGSNCPSTATCGYGGKFRCLRCANFFGITPRISRRRPGLQIHWRRDTVAAGQFADQALLATTWLT
jgi:hypothetical protein